VIQPLREFMDPEILAIVPNQIQDRMDQQTEDRKLLEALNRSDGLSQLLPSFASIAPEAWDAIDAGERPPPKPGIRYRKAFTQSLSADQPVKDFDPECDQLEHFATLADIVEAGGVDHE
jgi:chromosome partitioning protein